MRFKTWRGEDPDNGYPALEYLALQVEAAGERRGVRNPGRPGCVCVRKARERDRVPWWRPQVLLQAKPMGLRSFKGCKVREVCPEETQGHGAEGAWGGTRWAQGSFWGQHVCLWSGCV